MHNLSGYRPSNPFRTANIRPGANNFVFADPMVWPQLLQQVQQLRFCEIVGQHGTGKSTLYCQLTAACESWGWDVRRHVMDPRQPTLKWPPHDTITPTVRDECERLRAVDGYEQLPRRRRRAIWQHCQQNGERLLVTSHTHEGFHTLYRTHVDVSVARQVLAAILWREGLNWTVDNTLLEQSLRKHDGNLREVMFELFDVFASFAERLTPGVSA